MKILSIPVGVFGFKCARFVYKWALITALCVELSYILPLMFVGYSIFSAEMRQLHIHNIYNKLLTKTGQVQDSLPLVIADSEIDNAYNDGTKIVIYQGLIDHAASDDEIALVLAHEIAHGMLGHLNVSMPVPDQELGDSGKGENDYVSVLEANADKLGAVYMMKAGYDVCKGRELFRFWRTEHGNAIGQNHPDMSYRFDELNIGCE